MAPEDLLNTLVSDIPSVLLVLLWLGVLQRVRASGWLAALLRLVGTIGHEALHASVGWVLRAKPVSFSFIPKKVGDRWVFGSVGFTQLNIWNSAPVAFAPLLLAGVSWLVYQHWTHPALLAGSYASWALSGYVLATCLTGSIPSTIDIKIGALSALMYGAVGYFVWTSTLARDFLERCPSLWN